MTELYLRTWHRRMGIILALLVVLQAGSGLLLSFLGLIPGAGVEGSPWHALAEVMVALHLGGGVWGKIYRIFLGLGLLGMATSGTLIFFKIRARTPKS
uniref:PepSY domain-containing protein n=1 Tax=Desulfobacca acetoxidans TaxID=60893 RepID=A0A7V4G933_9BACT